MKVYFILPFLFFFGLKKNFAQQKFEKEYRIKKEQVPKDAINFIHAIAFDHKIKWYKEERIAGYSYEAKTPFRGVKYSIEFDAKGKIEDVEYEILWAVVPTVPQQKMIDFFDKTFQKWRIVKTQVHLNGPPQALIDLINQTSIPKQLVTKYELVVKGRKEQQSQMMEYLFSDKGTLEKQARIVFKSTDHLEY